MTLSPHVVVVIGQELYPLGTKVLIVLCQSESVIRESESDRSDTRITRHRRRRVKRDYLLDHNNLEAQNGSYFVRHYCRKIMCQRKEIFVLLAE